MKSWLLVLFSTSPSPIIRRREDGEELTKKLYAIERIVNSPAGFSTVRFTDFTGNYDLSNYDEDVAQKFERLAAQWEDETGGYSTAFKKSINPQYLQIIGMGKPALPLILRRLQEAPDHWFTALKSITGINPVEPGNINNLHKMREDWLNWGVKNGLL